MGYGLQESCFHAPGHTIDDSSRTDVPLPWDSSHQMYKNRKDQLERVMDETRLYSLLLVLPAEFIYKGSEHTTASKAATAKLFHEGYPEQHTNRKVPEEGIQK